MKKPIIGIVGRSAEVDNRSVIRLNEDYRLAIIQNGGIPFILLPTDLTNYGETIPREATRLTESEKEELYLMLSKCDGILMPGGSRWYQFDELVCEYALTHNIPILGICLGMQLLGNIDNFDGARNSDRTVKNETEIEHCQVDASYVHHCTIYPGLLHDILKLDEIRVNSKHNYHIIEKDGFVVDARSEDGLIEAIHIPNHKFALGVQWHPEAMLTYDPYMNRIFEAFIEATKQKEMWGS